jgi:regulator of replication initiation timing
MNSSTLRELWTLIDNIQPNILVSIDEKELIEQILNQLTENTSLDLEDDDLVSVYISSKMSLIRDLAESKLSYA